MATRRVLTHPPLLLLSRSSSSSAALSPPAAAPASSPVLLYDRLAAAVRSKIDRLSDPDPRFLRFASPHPTLADHSPILSLPPTRVTTLPNGVRVATESALACPTAAVGVWIDAGSRFEPEDASGVARLVERLVVIGSDKLREELASLGGCIEGFTGREMTVFKTRVLEKGVSKALEIVADLVQNPTFDEGAIQKERDAMIRDLEAEEQTEELLFNHLHATAFQYTPLGRTVSGSAQSIKTITVDHLKSYISTHYTGPRVVISAAGAVKHDDIVEQVKKLFPKLTADSFTAAQLVMKEPTAFTGSEVRIIDDDIPLAKFAVAFNGASLKDPDYLALMVMKTMLGSWNKNVSGGKHTGSTLVEKIAIDEIAESMTAFNLSYKDAGLFGVYAVAKPDCLDDLAYAIMYDISKLSYRVSEDDVTRARNQLKSSLQRHLDGTSAVAEDIGYQLLKYSRRIPTAELFARIDAVDAVTVKRVANRFIFDQDVAIAARGPIQSLPDYNWFRRRTYMNRY